MSVGVKAPFVVKETFAAQLQLTPRLLDEVVRLVRRELSAGLQAQIRLIVWPNSRMFASRRISSGVEESSGKSGVSVIGELC